jgi:hypothetical protein
MLVQVSPPTASTYAPNTTFVLSAAGSSDVDPGDQARLSPTWTLRSPSKTDALVPCPNEPSDLIRCLTATAVGDYVVQVAISDTPDAGASSPAPTATLPLFIRAGQPPTAEISLEAVSPPATGPFKLGSLFRVSSANSHRANGANDVTPRWAELQPPPGSNQTLGECDFNPSPSVRCFTADVAGIYRVGLTVSDAAGDSPAVFAPFTVLDDQPACIVDTSPGFDTPTSMTELTVETVDDDLDPYPPRAFMQWFVAGSGPTGVEYPLALADYPNFVLDTEPYAFGEVVKVRVEIHDRDAARSRQGFLACGDADTCTLPNAFRSPCFQRVTWTVRILNK